MKNISKLEIEKVVEKVKTHPHAKVTCAFGSWRMREELGGVVFGYSSYGNPTAKLPLNGAVGHYITLVDGHFIVDVWAELALGIKSVLDIYIPEEHEEVISRYGSPSCWHVEVR